MWSTCTRREKDTTKTKTERKHKKANNTHTNNRHNPQRRAVAEATMFEFVWYGTTKIWTLGPRPILIFEAQVPPKVANVKILFDLCTSRIR